MQFVEEIAYQPRVVVAIGNIVTFLNYRLWEKTFSNITLPLCSSSFSGISIVYPANRYFGYVWFHAISANEQSFNLDTILDATRPSFFARIIDSSRLQNPRFRAASSSSCNVAAIRYDKIYRRAVFTVSHLEKRVSVLTYLQTFYYFILFFLGKITFIKIVLRLHFNSYSYNNVFASYFYK